METKSHVTTPTLTKRLLGAFGAVVIVALSFYGGVSYQKSHASAASNTAATAAPNIAVRGGVGGFRRRSGRIVGTVTAVSPTSISVQNSRTGITSTLAITNATQITDNGQAATISDIQNGATVFVTVNTTNKNQAMTILINPGFGNGGSSSASGAGGGPAPNTSAD